MVLALCKTSKTRVSSFRTLNLSSDSAPFIPVLYPLSTLHRYQDLLCAIHFLHNQFDWSFNWPTSLSHSSYLRCINIISNFHLRPLCMPKSCQQSLISSITHTCIFPRVDRLSSFLTQPIWSYKNRPIHQFLPLLHSCKFNIHTI